MSLNHHPTHIFGNLPAAAVVIFSGGMDSFTLVNVLHHLGVKLHAISFNYGQRHAKELVYARSVCDGLDITHQVCDLAEPLNPLLQGSSLTTPDIPVPKGHYADETMKATVVPNRNMIMLSIAVGYAVSLELDHVFYGAHGGDHDIYPDCRPEFLMAMQSVCRVANYDPVYIGAPYLKGNKATILHEGFQLGLDYGNAWTCYEGGDVPCGECGACVERAEAFETLGEEDPAIARPEVYLDRYLEMLERIAA